MAVQIQDLNITFRNVYAIPQDLMHDLQNRPLPRIKFSEKSSGTMLFLY